MMLRCSSTSVNIVYSWHCMCVQKQTISEGDEVVLSYLAPLLHTNIFLMIKKQWKGWIHKTQRVKLKSAKRAATRKMLSKSCNLQLLSRLPRASILKDTSTSTTITPITSILKSPLTSSIRAFHFPTTHVGEVKIKMLLLTKYFVYDFESEQRPKIRFIASTPSCSSCLCRWPRYTCSHKDLVHLESGSSVFRHPAVFGRLTFLTMHIHIIIRSDSALQ